MEMTPEMVQKAIADGLPHVGENAIVIRAEEIVDDVTIVRGYN